MLKVRCDAEACVAEADALQVGLDGRSRDVIVHTFVIPLDWTEEAGTDGKILHHCPYHSSVTT